MPMTYIDKSIWEEQKICAVHPAYQLNIMSPFYKMERVGGFLDGLPVSVFKWDKEEALAMYDWYVTRYNVCRITNEFGENIDRYAWTRILSESHYLDDDADKNGGVSRKTIEELYEAVKGIDLADLETPESPYK